MTAPNGAIVFNNSTGSDTTASGMGSANVYGTGASITGASAVVTGINTTGVAVGDLLWVQSSTGRQFSIISSIDSGTQVTCDDNFDVTESSRTWAIGGKRANLSSAIELFDYYLNSGRFWEIELETDQSLTTMHPTGSNTIGVSIKSSVPGTKRNLIFNDQYALRGGTWELHDLALSTLYTASNAYLCISSNSGSIFNTDVYAYDCDFVDPVNQFGILAYNTARAASFYFYGCRFMNFQTYILQNHAVAEFRRCYIANNTTATYCFAITNTGSALWKFHDCIIANNRGWMYPRNGYFGTCVGTIVYNTYDYLLGAVTPGKNRIKEFERCIFVNNAGAVSSNFQHTMMHQCAFYNNANINATTGDYRNIGNVDLTADPFVDAANGDFNINNDAGGGKLLRDATFDLNSSTQIRPFHGFAEPLQPTRSKHPLART